MTASAWSALFVAAAGLVGFTAVAVAAGMRHLTAGDTAALDLTDIATRYMLLHAVALLGLAAMLSGESVSRLLVAAGCLFILGCILFGGGIILLAVTGWRGFAVVVPVGGTSFMAGWLALMGSGLARYRRERRR